MRILYEGFQGLANVIFKLILQPQSIHQILGTNFPNLSVWKSQVMFKNTT